MKIIMLVSVMLSSWSIGASQLKMVADAKQGNAGDLSELNEAGLRHKIESIKSSLEAMDMREKNYDERIAELLNYESNEFAKNNWPSSRLNEEIQAYQDLKQRLIAGRFFRIKDLDALLESLEVQQNKKYQPMIIELKKQVQQRFPKEFKELELKENIQALRNELEGLIAQKNAFDRELTSLSNLQLRNMNDDIEEWFKKFDKKRKDCYWKIYNLKGIPDIAKNLDYQELIRRLSDYRNKLKSKDFYMQSKVKKPVVVTYDDMSDPMELSQISDTDDFVVDNFAPRQQVVEDFAPRR